MDPPFAETMTMMTTVGAQERHEVNELDFVDFYKREYPSMVALASSLVGRSAEDIAQEAMIRAHQRWAKVSKYDNPATWVRRVTINLATSTLRRRATRIRKASLLLHGTPEVVWPTPFDDELSAAIASLPKNQRVAVVLHYLDDLPVRDIAAALDCAPATAKVHLHRGRQALAEHLGRQNPDTKNDPDTTNDTESVQ